MSLTSDANRRAASYLPEIADRIDKGDLSLTVDDVRTTVVQGYTKVETNIEVIFSERPL